MGRMDGDSEVKFLDLVPLVHSSVRGWSTRTVRSKDIHEIKTLNVCYRDKHSGS